MLDRGTPGEIVQMTQAGPKPDEVFHVLAQEHPKATAAQFDEAMQEAIDYLRREGERNCQHAEENGIGAGTRAGARPKQVSLG